MESGKAAEQELETFTHPTCDIYFPDLLLFIVNGTLSSRSEVFLYFVVYETQLEGVQNEKP